MAKTLVTTGWLRLVFLVKIFLYQIMQGGSSTWPLTPYEAEEHELKLTVKLVLQKKCLCTMLPGLS